MTHIHLGLIKASGNAADRETPRYSIHSQDEEVRSKGVLWTQEIWCPLALTLGGVLAVFARASEHGRNQHGAYTLVHRKG